MDDADGSVLFVVTPFLPEHQPALGVSSLSSVLRRSGIRSEILYLNIEFQRKIGAYLYALISRGLPSEVLLGEMIFEPALSGTASADWGKYEARLRAEFPLMARLMIHDENEAHGTKLLDAAWEGVQERIVELRSESLATVQSWADEILRRRPRIAAMSSTFQQNLASLALAQELRRRASGDELLILLGGGNCEGDMGAAIAGCFPFVDHVVSGEAEDVIVDLVARFLDGGRRAMDLPRHVTGRMVQHMDDLPLPDFHEYFGAVRGSGLESTCNLVAESSRGCWWGAKSHCVFCGLNGHSLTYRSKTPERFAAELQELVARHQIRTFIMSDNIMSLSYAEEFFPLLVARDCTVNMLYETKSNLRKEQLVTMAAAGVRRIQPGIESLSDNVLKSMAKGTTRLQNLRVLKWCEELGISVKWNILFGFAGETPEDFSEMAGLIPLLHHLPPPDACAPARLDRFSPQWEHPEKFGLRNVRPFWAHDFAYAVVPVEERARLAYCFNSDRADDLDVDALALPVARAARQWRHRYEHGARLELQRVEGHERLLDSRREGHEETHEVGPRERWLLRAIDAGITLTRLRETGAGDGITAAEVDEAIAKFLDHGWALRSRDRVLGLVVDRGQRERVYERRTELSLRALGLTPAAMPGAE